MYVRPNVRTKKALVEILKGGQDVQVFQPGLGSVPRNGTVDLEGPWFPEPHRWYAEGVMKDGRLVSVR
jgi:hypothetical protein